MSRRIMYLVLGILLFWMCYPCLFLVTGSLMGEGELSRNLGVIFSEGESGYVTWSLLPKEPNLWAYVKVLLDSPEYLTAFWNTVCLAAVTLILQCIVNIPAAWGMAAYRFKGRKEIFWLYILLLILPFQVLMLPQYLVLDRLGFLNTIWAVILPAAVSPLFLFIVYYDFHRIPKALIEMARVEGAGEWEIFLKIGIPLANKGILIAGLFSLIESFNLIEQPMLFWKSKELWPLSLYLPNARMERVGENFASAVIFALPVLLLYLCGQRVLRETEEKG